MTTRTLPGTDLMNAIVSSQSVDNHQLISHEATVNCQPAVALEQLPYLDLAPADWRSTDAIVQSLTLTDDQVRLLDRQDRRIERAQLIAALDDQTTQRAVDLEQQLMAGHAVLTKRLPRLRSIVRPDLVEQLNDASYQKRPAIVTRAVAASLGSSNQRKVCMFHMLREAELLGSIEWHHEQVCAHCYPRLVSSDKLLRDSGPILESVIGTGRRIEETFSSEREVELTTILQNHEHRLINARRWDIGDALKQVAMPGRIRTLLHVIERTAHRDSYEVVTGDLYDGSVREQHLATTTRTVRETWKNVWVACEPAVVHTPTNCVIAGWLDAND